MRRLIALALLLSLALAVPATAQMNLNKWPSGILDRTTAAVTIANSATATTMYSYYVPANISQNLRGTIPGGGALHLTLVGLLTTNAYSVGNTNIGCNFGGTTATISLVNASAFTAGLSAIPVSYTHLTLPTNREV